MRRILLSILTFAIAFAIAAPALAETIDWTDNEPVSGTVVGTEVEYNGPGTFPIVTIDEPDIIGDEYAVTGSVRYESIAGEAYLEMWSFFADGGAYFSRTLATDGPQGVLTGSSSGRGFALPFLLNGAEAPIRLEVNVVLPAAGTVWIGPLTLEGVADSGQWWSEQSASIVGASLGIAAGLSGALIGLLSGRRRAQRLVTGLLVAGVVIGVLCLLAGGIAALASQPRHVWYPLVLVGGILVVVDGALLPATRRSYAAAEVPRMKALDAR